VIVRAFERIQGYIYRYMPFFIILKKSNTKMLTTMQHGACDMFLRAGSLACFVNFA